MKSEYRIKTIDREIIFRRWYHGAIQIFAKYESNPPIGIEKLPLLEEVVKDLVKFLVEPYDE